MLTHNKPSTTPSLPPEATWDPPTIRQALIVWERMQALSDLLWETFHNEFIELDQQRTLDNTIDQHQPCEDDLPF